MYDIVIIGHVSKDVMEYVDSTEHVLGGAVVYASAASVRSGASVLVVTKAANSDKERLSPLYESGATVELIESPQTTSIRNVYHTEDKERRTVTLLQAADPFRAEEIPAAEARTFYLAGLFAGEIPDELIETLAARGDVALDVQGVLRTSEDGSLVFRDWTAKDRYLPSIRYLKTDAAECEVLTGTDDRAAGARMLANMGAGEVMVTHSSEVLLATRSEAYAVPITARNLSGRTGRGDTCFGAYLAWRAGHEAREALAYATAVVSLKLESPGVFRASREAVLERMKEQGEPVRRW